ncbi:MAG TPA: hypothetical protein VJV75_09820 [Candidatus Polarisedimenticolia bacterium]|nr:hypothetical protein [Candidatus Polarisedimenticolia bacterium]
MRACPFARSVAVASLIAVLAALAAAPARAQSIPTCKKPFARVVVLEPDVDWWSDMGLGSPRGLIETFVDESGCFTRLTSVANDQREKADFTLTPDALSAFPDRPLGPTRGPATDGVGGDGAAGRGPNSDGMNGSPAVSGKVVGTRDVAVVELTLADQRTGKRPIKTRGTARGTAGSSGRISTPGGASAAVNGYSRSELGRRVMAGYLEAYRDLITTLQRQAAKEMPKKD